MEQQQSFIHMIYLVHPLLLRSIPLKGTQEILSALLRARPEWGWVNP